jgi:hypothetical protein
MKAEPFTSRNTAADDIQALVTYLKSHDNGRFLYRGQTKDYGSCLLPSVFRGALNEKDIGEITSLAKHGVTSMRSLGTTFVGNYVTDARTPKSSLRSDAAESEAQRADIQRRLLNTFGYVYGTALAQHYGFKSGALDATTNIDIAAFFATHSPPDYCALDYATDDHAHTDRLGVIFRFELCQQPMDNHSLMQMTYFDAPGTLLLTKALETLESEIDIAESWRSLRYYYELFRASGDRHLELLRIPHGACLASRLGRQSAAIVIPDEIQLRSDKTVCGVHPIFGTPTIHTGQNPLVFQSIEDLRTRPGTVTFFFQQRGGPFDQGFSAHDLWPNETDDLLHTLAYVLSYSFSCYKTQEENIVDPLSILDPGIGSLNRSLIEARIRSQGPHADDYEDTLRFAERLHDTGEQLNYYVHKAANAFARVHITGDGDLLRLAIRLCEHARIIDTTSVVLAIFCNILYDALGEKGKAQTALASAFEIVEAERRPEQDPLQGIEIVQQILKDLYRAQWSPARFPGLLLEYYQSF